MLGAIEAGGTKMVCAIGDSTGKIIDRVVIPTTTPEDTMPQMIAYFKEHGPIESLGVAAFGPVGVNPLSPNYGRILDTPKLAWKQYPLVQVLEDTLQVPIGLDTDVNAACLGEMTYGSARDLDSVLYLTIGTGIGAGIAVGGRLVHGMLHPEAGHILMTPQPGDEANCICPYHSACFEGLASGPSIEHRYGEKADRLQNQEEVWELESEYIAQALTQYIMVVSPQRIILGGGVMHQEQLFALVRRKVIEKIHGYLNTRELQSPESYIVPASLEGNQGIMGCLKLAADALL